MRSDNYYYEYNASASSWNYFSEGQHTIGDGKQEIPLDMMPLLQAIASDGYNTNSDFRGMVGCYQPGSYYNNNGILIENEYGLRIFYITRTNPTGETNRPVTHNHSYNSNYGQLQDVSLALTPSNSLYTAQLKDFLLAQQNTRLVVVTVIAEKIPANLHLYQKIRIKNNQFLIVERNRNLGASNLIEFKLLRI